MMNFLRKRKLSSLGIHIGLKKIHLMQLIKRKQTYSIHQMEALSSQKQLIAEGKIKDWDEMTKQLSEWVDRNHYHHFPTAISIPTSLVRIQQIELLKELSHQEIIEVITQKDFRGMQELLAIDYEIISENKDSIIINYAATRNEYLNQYIECVNSAGLKVKIVDIDSYALKRCLHFAYPQFENQESYAILQIENSRFSLHYFVKQNLSLYQEGGFSDYQTLIENIKSNINFYLNTHSKLSNLFIDGNVGEFNTLHSFFNPVVTCHHLPSITFNQQTFFSSYFISFGLTLRNIPQW